MKVLLRLEQAGFLATEADIEAMAREHQQGVDQVRSINGAYLKILVALTAQEIGTRSTVLSKRRGPARHKLAPNETADHLLVFTAVHNRCYDAVLRAVVTRDIADSETLTQEERTRRSLLRNSRTIYARTAASTLRRFILAGGDVRDLDVATATKGLLRERAGQLAPPAPVAAAARLIKKVSRDAERTAKDIQALAQVDATKALLLLNELVDKLHSMGHAIEHPKQERRAA